MKSTFYGESERRQFLKNALSAGALICAGCHQLFAGEPSLSAVGSHTNTDLENDTGPDTGMTPEEVVRFTLGYCVPTYQFLLKEMGKEKFLKLLREASIDNKKQLIDSLAKDMPDRNLNQLAELVLGYLGTPPFNKIFTTEVVEKSDTVLEIKYTRCLFAEVYREMNASDIGFIVECGGSKDTARAYNPEINVSLSSSMMKGDNHCTKRFEVES